MQQYNYDPGFIAGVQVMWVIYMFDDLKTTAVKLPKISLMQALP